MATGTLSINLDAVVANWRALDAMSTGQTAAVVKADGYGLGAALVGAALTKAGVREFFVAVAEEGVILRKALGEGPVINVFSGHMQGDTELLKAAALTPMLNAPEQIARHRAALPGHPFGLQIDTGMNRLGIESYDWDLSMASDATLIMSHLACADAPDHSANAAQLEQFKSMTQGSSCRRSLAATGGILLGQAYHFDLVRPGIGLYGGLPFEEAERVVSLSLPVIQTRLLQPGESAGYGCAFTANKQTRIATLSAGYADGLIRAMSGKATLYADGIACPLAGRVSMDLLTVDITHLDHSPTEMEILGPHQTVDHLAEAAGTIGYEILTSLGARYARISK